MIHIRNQRVISKHTEISKNCIDFYNEKNLDDEDSLSELEEYIINYDEPFFLKRYLSNNSNKQIYGNENRIIYQCAISEILTALEIGEIIYNNDKIIDHEIFKTFYRFDITSFDPIILALRMDKNSIYEVIDGLHRLMYLKSLSANNNLLMSLIPVDVRVCYDESDFKKYIDANNNRRLYTSDQLKKYKYPVIIELLNTEYNNEFFTMSYVKINKDLFKEKIFGLSYFNNFNNSAENIFQKIKEINMFLKNISNKARLSIDRDMSKKSYSKEYEKGRKMNFYLGFDQKLNWLKLMEYDEYQWECTWNSFFDKK
jgi:hypothetical protein